MRVGSKINDCDLSYCDMRIYHGHTIKPKTFLAYRSEYIRFGYGWFVIGYPNDLGSGWIAYNLYPRIIDVLSRLSTGRSSTKSKRQKAFNLS